ncbi:Thaumatin-like protein [Linum perenne]
MFCLITTMAAMSPLVLKTLPLITAVLLIFTSSTTKAVRFDVTNRCPYTVWAAAASKPGFPFGGGRQLNNGQTWTIDNVPAGITEARIWARTGCQFDGAGRGKCQTGDCGGVLACKSYGQAPNTLAEFALKQYMDQDFIDISVIDGYNVPMEFSSASPNCKRVIKCTGNIIGQCPNELKVQGGCNGACPQLKREEFCCNSGNCGPTPLSRYFKDRCPDAYSYPKDDPTSLFTCPFGVNYKVIFCP